MTRRRRARPLLLAGLLGCAAAAVGFFAAGVMLPGALATIAGLVIVAAAARHARPGNWTPEDREGR